MRKTLFVTSILLGVAACSEPTQTSGSTARGMTRVSSPMQGVRADGELVPFPELNTVPEVAVGALQQAYRERLDDRSLVDAVRRTGGRVSIGFKPADHAHTYESGRIPAMSRAQVMAAREQIQARAIRLLRTYRNISDVVAEIDPEQAPAIRRLPFVNYLEPDEAAQPASQDTSWGLKKIAAHTVWTTYGYHGEYASITMIDSGVDSTHVANFGLDGPETLLNCLYASPTASSCYQHTNHGAAVAGIMSARDNSAGYVGIAYAPYRFSSVNVCNPLAGCPWSAMTAGLDWAVSSGYARHIVNISIQACDGNSTFASSLAQATNAGILVVSVAGNTDFSCSSGTGAGTSGVTYPGKYSQVVAVSGTMEDDSFATGTSPCSAGSRSGPEVDLSAPFWHPSMTISGGWSTWCGTSFSAPTVAAAAAVLWSANTLWTASQVFDRLKLTSVDRGSPGFDSQFGWGRIALYSAFSTVPTLTAFISGNTYVNEGVEVTFSASASGGVPPYVTYTWRIDGNVQQSGSSSSFSWTAYSSYTVSVTVTDNASTTSSPASLEVTVVNCPPPQITCN